MKMTNNKNLNRGGDMRMTYLNGPLMTLAILGVAGMGVAGAHRAHDDIEDRSLVVVQAPSALSRRLHRRAALKLDSGVSTGTAKAETVLLDESFEGSWPNTPWVVFHATDSADVDWGRRNHRASDGSFSIWCAGSGSEAPEDGGLAPVEAAVWTVAGPFDLSEASTGNLTFDLWLKTELFHDNFMWLVSTDGENFTGRASSSDTGGWTTLDVDLTDWVDGLDVTGEPLVWIAFVYQSDHDIRFEGAYVDKVRLLADSGEQAAAGRTYTTDADFALGSSIGLEAEADSLRMSESWSAFPYLWVPSSIAGTVSKVDSETGDELARYRTGPAEVTLNPIPTVVDLDGNCWVGNRDGGTVVKIGLAERWSCVDRNGNGAIDTSSDRNGDGDISSDEMQAWGEDECVLFEVVLVAGEEGAHTPGDQHGNYSSNRLQALAVDEENRLWVGVADRRSFFLIDGDSGEILNTVDLGPADTRPYAAAVAAGGDLWCSSWPDTWILKIDPETDEILKVDLDHGSRGLALDGSQHLFVSGFRHSRLSRVDLSTDDVDLSLNADYEASGMAVTEDGQLWVAAPGSQVVRRYSTDGVILGSLQFANRPSAVALDGAGKVWITGQSSGVLVRINPQTMNVETQKQLLNIAGINATGDLTGLVARSLTVPYGSWTVVYDSQQKNTAWDTLSWAAVEPEGTELRVRVRSSHDKNVWSGWEVAVNEDELVSTAAGRYLEIEVAMKRPASDESPLLDEITVTPRVVETAPEALFSWSPSHPIVGQTISFTDNSGNEPTAWTWDFGDDGTSSEQHPAHVYTSAGTFTVSLTAGNQAGDATVTDEVVVSLRTTVRTSTAPLS